MIKLPRKPIRRLAIPLLLLATASPWSSLTAQASSPGSAAGFRADYVVQVKDTAQHLFHVTATFSGIDQPSLDLALPVWTPGWYTLEYYAKNIHLFTVTDGEGGRLRAPLVGPQTWRIDTEGRGKIVVDFDYFADVLSLNQAKITPEFAFFTGTQLFLEPVGHRDAAYTVRFEVPTRWGIATALADTPDPSIFTAEDYDALVDAPAWLGSFQIHEFEVLGKPHFVVTNADADLSAEAIATYTERASSQIRVAASIFGGLPYDKYLIFELPGQPEDDAAGALEHANAYVECCGGTSQIVFNPHEFFHLWNVKRIRPAGMWPYDYSGPNLTPSLWFSEGVTSYYGGKILYRAGLRAPEILYPTPSPPVEGNRDSPVFRYADPERPLMSLADASIATWRDYLHEPVHYYPEGSIVGALLDLSILHDTKGRRGLDDVMRSLYEDYYQRGLGFSPHDLIQTVSSVAGRDYGDFYRRFIAGSEFPPFDSIMGFAGFRAVEQQVGLLGAWGPRVEQGRRLDGAGTFNPDGPAGRAGARIGDILVAVDERPLAEVRFTPNGCCVFREKGDTSSITLTLLRDGARLNISVVPSLLERQRLEAFGPLVDGGRLIQRVNLYGPAVTAGIYPGDLIVALDGTPVADVNMMSDVGCCLLRSPGDARPVVVTVLRDGRTFEVPVVPRPFRTIAVEAVTNPTAEQLAVRNAWLRREPGGSR